MEVVFCLAAFLLVNALGAWYQQPLTHNNGQGWDGGYYYHMAEQFAVGAPVQEMRPFCYRVGLPFLAAAVQPHNLMLGFKIVDHVANVMFLVLFVLWLRLFIRDWRVRGLMVLLLLTQWFGMFRAIYFYPCSTDYAFYPLFMLGLFCIQWTRSRPVAASLCLASVVFVGIAFREVIFLLALGFLFVGNPIRFQDLRRNLLRFDFAKILQPPRLVYFLPVVAGVCSIYLTHKMVQTVPSYYGFLSTAWVFLWEKPWFAFLLGAFIAFGPVLILALFNWRGTWRFLAANQALSVIALGCWTLAYVAGNDTERYWSWSLPVVYVLIGLAIEENRLLLMRSKGLLLVLALAQAVSQRFFWTIPDYPNNFVNPFPVLTLPSSNVQYLDLFSIHGSRFVEFVAFVEYSALAVILLWWLAARSRASGPTEIEEKPTPVSSGAPFVE